MTVLWKQWSALEAIDVVPTRRQRFLRWLLRRPRSKEDGRTYAWIVGTDTGTWTPPGPPQKLYLVGSMSWTIFSMWAGRELRVNTADDDPREFLWLVDGVPQDETGRTLALEPPAEGKQLKVEVWASGSSRPTEIGRPVVDQRGDAPELCKNCGHTVDVRTGRDHVYVAERDLERYAKYGIVEPGRYVTLWDAWTCPACGLYGPVWYAATG